MVLIENDIPFYEFPPEVIACLPQDDWVITDEEVAKRWDLRDRHVCSVDPPGACVLMRCMVLTSASPADDLFVSYMAEEDFVRGYFRVGNFVY